LEEDVVSEVVRKQMLAQVKMEYQMSILKHKLCKQYTVNYPLFYDDWHVTNCDRNYSNMQYSAMLY
jgi:hypothetical protein